jgi:hypothetical protein
MTTIGAIEPGRTHDVVALVSSVRTIVAFPTQSRGFSLVELPAIVTYEESITIID